MKIYYQEISIKALKRMKCSCGNRFTRVKKFYQTLNPFNRNYFGGVKSESEIYEENLAAATKWQSEIEPCPRNDRIEGSHIIAITFPRPTA